mgnify:CR=1 FL=1
MSREYKFQLPYNIPCMFIGMAVSSLQDKGLWEDLPVNLKRKIKQAQQGWDDIQLTREDLDSISDELWEKIAIELELG